MNKDSFLYKALCEEHNGKLYPSSKRLAGFVCIVVTQLCIFAATVLELVFARSLSGTVSSLLITDLSIGAGLIGLKTIATAFQGDKTKISDGPVEDDDEEE